MIDRRLSEEASDEKSPLATALAAAIPRLRGSDADEPALTGDVPADELPTKTEAALLAARRLYPDGRSSRDCRTTDRIVRPSRTGRAGRAVVGRTRNGLGRVVLPGRQVRGGVGSRRSRDASGGSGSSAGGSLADRPDRGARRHRQYRTVHTAAQRGADRTARDVFVSSGHAGTGVDSGRLRPPVLGGRAEHVAGRRGRAFSRSM